MNDLSEPEILDRLCGLLPAQFEVLLIKAEVEREFLSGASAPQALRANETVVWSRQSPHNRRRLLGALGKVREDIAADPLLDWQQVCYESYRHLRIVGFEDLAKVSLDLDQIFVELDVRAGRPRGKSPLRLEKQAEHFEDSVRVDLREALELVERLRSDGAPRVGLVLIGDPGAGKTTLLRHLFCGVLREKSQGFGLPADLTPVFVRFARITRDDLRARGLEAVVHRQAEADGKPRGAEALLQGNPKLLLLLDGLDEVRDEEMRADISEWLRDEVRRWPDSRFVATCRFAAWRGRATLDNQFVAAEIQWLDPEKVKTYVQRWFKAVRRGLRVSETLERVDREAAEQAAALLEVLLDPKRQEQYGLREMTENPLLLSTLCLVHHAGNRLPDQRGDLYNKCIGLLLDAWARTRGPHLPATPARQVLQPLAWAMQEERAQAGQRPFSGDEVRSLIAEPLRGVPALTGMAPERFLELARENCGVLASRDVDSYEFFHLSFQEYLAAAYAVERGQVARLADHAGDQAWRETILLAMSLPGAFGPFMERLLRSREVAQHAALLQACFAEAAQVYADPQPFAAFLARAGKSKAPQVQAVAVVLRLFAGSDAPAVWRVVERLRGHADAALRQVAGHAWATSSAGRATRVEVVVAGEAAPVVLAGRPTSPKPGDVWQDAATGLTLVWIPPGEFLMGASPWKGGPGYDPQAWDYGTSAQSVRITEGFWIGQHTVTNDLYGRFLAAGGQDEPEYWRNRRFNAPQQPVVGVSFVEALAFCNWATKHAGLSEDIGFQLPTEAEWEYAARSETGRRYPWGDAKPTPERAVFGLSVVAGAPAPVGQRPQGATPLGVHDMAGNVWEWCLDGWRDHAHRLSTVDLDPCFVAHRAAPRVVRGGSWDVGATWLRCAARVRSVPGSRSQLQGFRVVCRRFRPYLDD